MDRKTKNILITGCLMSALAVGIGAFGAHGLKDLLAENGRTDVFETGVKYHFYHSLAILITGLINHHLHSKWIVRSFYMLLTGIIIFSVSLYILAITNINILGAVTPFGGVLLIAGWLALALGIKKGIE